MSIEPNQMMRSLGLNEATVQARFAMLLMSEHDRRLLKESWPHIQPSAESFVRTLYSKFVEVPYLRTILNHQSRVERLKQAQLAYLEHLWCGAIDKQYIQRLMEIGGRHYRVGLTPQWYIASYSFFLTEHIEALFSTAGDNSLGLQRVLALFKSMVFDTSLILDAYGLSLDASRFSTDSFSNPEPNTIDVARGATSVISRDAHEPIPSSRRLRLSSEEATQRADFIGLDLNQLQYLRKLKEPFGSIVPIVLDEFYYYLLNTPELSKLITPERASAQIRQVSIYWQELLDSPFDQAYALRRMRLGTVHEQLAIEPQLYLTGLCRQVVGLLSRLPLETPELPLIIKQFFQAIFFDVSFVIDAYLAARAESLVRTEGYANELVREFRSSIVVVDRAGKILFANPQFVDLVGIDAALLCRMPLEDAVRLPELSELIERFNASGDSRKIGKVNWSGRLFSVNVSKLSFTDGKTNESTAIVLDNITSLSRTLRESEDDLRQSGQIAQSLPAVAWEMDLESGAIISIADPVLELTGYDAVWFIGKANAWLKCLNAADIDRFVAVCHRLALGERGSCDYRMIRADGQEIWVRSLIRKTRNHQARATVTAVSFDISKDKESESRRMAAIAQITGGIAHSINNSLTVVQNSVELLGHHAADVDRQQLAQLGLSACSRAAAIVSHLMTFSGQQYMASSRPTGRAQLLEQLQSLVRTQPENVTVSVKVSPDLWDVNLDLQQFMLAVNHLWLNARQAMPFGGTFVCEALNLPAVDTSFEDPAFNRDWIQFRFTDSGQGMPPEILKRAIEPFYTTRNRAEADGLGLSFVHGFVTQAGGHMLLDSAPARGCTILLRFPRYETPAENHIRLAKPSILFLDDDEQILETVAGALAKHGYPVFAAANTSDAWRHVATRHIDVLIADVLLREATDGYEFAQQLSLRMPNVRVILVSGLAHAALRDRSLPAHWSYLPKPYRIADLVERIEPKSSALYI